MSHYIQTYSRHCFPACMHLNALCVSVRSLYGCIATFSYGMCAIRLIYHATWGSTQAKRFSSSNTLHNSLQLEVKQDLCSASNFCPYEFTFFAAAAALATASASACRSISASPALAFASACALSASRIACHDSFPQRLCSTMHYCGCANMLLLY
jgi:hypothetical protein